MDLYKDQILRRQEAEMTLQPQWIVNRMIDKEHAARTGLIKELGKMSCILNGCVVKFQDTGESFICDAYMIGDTFIFKFNRNMYEQSIPPDDGCGRDCVVDRDGELLVWDRTNDLATLVVHERHVYARTPRLNAGVIHYRKIYRAVTA